MNSDRPYCSLSGLNFTHHSDAFTLLLKIEETNIVTFCDFMIKLLWDIAAACAAMPMC